MTYEATFRNVSLSVSLSLFDSFMCVKRLPENKNIKLGCIFKVIISLSFKWNMNVYRCLPIFWIGTDMRVYVQLASVFRIPVVEFMENEEPQQPLSRIYVSLMLASPYFFWRSHPTVKIGAMNNEKFGSTIVTDLTALVISTAITFSISCLIWSMSNWSLSFFFYSHIFSNSIITHLFKYSIITKRIIKSLRIIVIYRRWY